MDTAIDYTINLVSGWVLRRSPGGAKSASHTDGTGFSFDPVNGLAATCHQSRCLPVDVVLWLTGATIAFPHTRVNHE